MAGKKKKKSPPKKSKKAPKKSPSKSKGGKKKPVAKKKKEKKKVPAPKKKPLLKKIRVPEKPIKAAPAKPVVPEKKESKKDIPVVPAPPPVESKKRKTPTPKIPQKKVIVMQPVYPHMNKPLQRTTEKEPNGKFTLEYVVRASPQILYEFVSTPSGLAEWFADDVNITKDHYSFIWNGQEQNANVMGMKEDQFIRFQWAEKNDGSYFEFRIELDDLTGDVSLMITDFAEESDQESSRLLWDSQVQKLMKVLGSY